MKKEERIHRIRDVLLKMPVTGFKDIQDKTGIADKELASDLKELLESGEISREISKKDARRKEYRLNNQRKALVESKRFAAVEFIKNLGPDINFAEAKKRKYGFLSRCSTFTNQKDIDMEMMNSMAHRVAAGLLENIRIELDTKQLEGIDSSYKIAYVVTMEKEDVKP